MTRTDKNKITTTSSWKIETGGSLTDQEKLKAMFEDIGVRWHDGSYSLEKEVPMVVIENGVHRKTRPVIYKSFVAIDGVYFLFDSDGGYVGHEYTQGDSPYLSLRSGVSI